MKKYDDGLHADKLKEEVQKNEIEQLIEKIEKITKKNADLEDVIECV